MGKKKGEKKGEVMVVKTKPIENVQQVEQQSLSIMNPETLISQAIKQNASVDTMERLLKMRQDLKAEFAKEQFDISMANFQMDCPIVKKTKSVPTSSGAIAYKYAPIESIVSQVKKYLKKHGFSYMIKTETLEKKVKAICVVKHKDGHSEESSMSVPLGTKTNIMSETQVVAAALTFAKRYAFCNSFGILTGDSDDDGKSFGAEKKDEKKGTSDKDLESRALKQIELAKEKQDVDTLIKVDEYVQKYKFNKGFKNKVKKLTNEAVGKIETSQRS